MQKNEKNVIRHYIKHFYESSKNKIIFLLYLYVILSSFFSFTTIFGDSPDLVISTELNKNNFISGESIVMSTQANLVSQESPENVTITPFQGKLQLYIFRLSPSLDNIEEKKISSIPYLNEVYGGNIQLTQSKQFLTNGSIDNYIFDAPSEKGKYAMIFEGSVQYDNKDHFYYYVSYFNIVSPLFTIWGISFVVSLIAIIGLIVLIVLSTKNIEFTIFEISRFICISAITLPIIFGLIFIDSEWGRNSPISVIKFYDTSSEERLGNQWIVNIGGIKIDNYRAGIFIPVFVIIFGLVGGYLRYLHRTILQKENVEYSSYIDEYLFNWNELTGSNYESNKFKQYLNSKFRITWINDDRHFENVSPNELKIESPDKKNLISTKLNETEDKIVINLNGQILDTLIARKANNQILVYARVEKKNWLFYQSLGDLTILVMAPLLAIAAWFLLTTAGVYDKYIIATVSFAIGLITENIINRLINFSEVAFKGK